MRTRVKLTVTALALMLVIAVATYIIQGSVSSDDILAATYTGAFALFAAAFVVIYIVLWTMKPVAPAGAPVFTDKQKRLIKTGLWFVTVQIVATILFIIVQWTPAFGLSDTSITMLSLIPMIIYGIETVAITVFVIWKWN